MVWGFNSAHHRPIGRGSSAGDVAGERRQRVRGSTATSAWSPARSGAVWSNVLWYELQGVLGEALAGWVDSGSEQSMSSPVAAMVESGGARCSARGGKEMGFIGGRGSWRWLCGRQVDAWSRHGHGVDYQGWWRAAARRQWCEAARPSGVCGHGVWHQLRAGMRHPFPVNSARGAGLGPAVLLGSRCARPRVRRSRPTRVSARRRRAWDVPVQKLIGVAQFDP
jgi:hypothetical protein